MMLELHPETKSHLIFAAVSILQQKVGKIWVVHELVFLNYFDFEFNFITHK